MTVGKFRKGALKVPLDQRRNARTQFGALCWRMRDDKVQVLLVTSRRTRRWIVPKGWPIEGETPAGAAAVEALEEAGVEGRVKNRCLGIYSYAKRPRSGRKSLPCVVAVFPIKVKKLQKDFQERRERKRKWVSQQRAAKLVQEPELSEIIRRFSPKAL